MTARTAERPRYHHGDLRAALIEAAGRLIAEGRVETFSVAEAARVAGVSSGAPYRHFADRDDLLDHVAAAGFERMEAHNRAAMARAPENSLESLIAGGCAYVDFAAAEPELFHLMWGAARPHGPKGAARAVGARCHERFIETFGRTLAAQGLGHLDAYAVSTPLWAMVHGFAMLRIGPAERPPRDPEVIHAMIGSAVRAYFDGLRRP